MSFIHHKLSETDSDQISTFSAGKWEVSWLSWKLFMKDNNNKVGLVKMIKTSGRRCQIKNLIFISSNKKSQHTWLPCDAISTAGIVKHLHQIFPETWPVPRSSARTGTITEFFFSKSLKLSAECSWSELSVSILTVGLTSHFTEYFSKIIPTQFPGRSSSEGLAPNVNVCKR